METPKISNMLPYGWQPVLGWIRTFIVLNIQVLLFILIPMIIVITAVTSTGAPEIGGEIPTYTWLILGGIELLIVLLVSIRFLQIPRGQGLDIRFQRPLTESELNLFMIFAGILAGLAIIGGHMLASASSVEFWDLLSIGVLPEQIDLMRFIIELPVVWQLILGFVFGILVISAETLFFHAIFQQGIQKRSSKTVGVILVTLAYVILGWGAWFYILPRIPRAILYAQRNNLILPIAFFVFELILVESIFMFTLPS